MTSRLKLKFEHAVTNLPCSQCTIMQSLPSHAVVYQAGQRPQACLGIFPSSGACAMAVCGSSKLLLSGRVRPCGALCACIQSPARLVYVKKGHRRTWPRHRHVYPTHRPTRYHSLLFSCPSLWRRRDLVVHTPLNCQSCQSHSYHHALSQSSGGGRGLHTTACVCLFVARPSKHLVTREDARVWVSSLTPNERNNLEWALQEVEPSETGTYE